MKKLVLVLVLALIAAPSFGALELTLTDNGNGTVTLGYTGAESTNLPRAFGLTVSANNGGVIDAISGYKQGESTAAAPGFGIYPATIDINSVTGNVNNYGTPLAVQGDPGADDQVLPSAAFVVEFGSLYAGDANAPATSGTLCIFGVDMSGATDDVTISVGEEDTYRGGVVLEDGTVPATELTATVVIAGGCDEPVAATTPTPTNGAVGVSMFPTQPTLSWSPAAGGDNPRYDVYFGTTSPGSLVSSNQTATSYTVSGAVQGQTYYWKVVSKNDCNAVGVSSAVWSFNTDCFVGGTAGTGEYAKWVEYGKPSCWCFKKQCRGDADGKKTALKPVANPDLVIFKEAFNKSKAVVKTLVVTGVPGICADFDHKDSALKPVANPDLLIYKEYFNDADGTVPVCNAAPVITGPVNFWTN